MAGDNFYFMQSGGKREFSHFCSSSEQKAAMRQNFMKTLEEIYSDKEDEPDSPILESITKDFETHTFKHTLNLLGDTNTINSFSIFWCFGWLLADCEWEQAYTKINVDGRDTITQGVIDETQLTLSVKSGHKIKTADGQGMKKTFEGFPTLVYPWNTPNKSPNHVVAAVLHRFAECIKVEVIDNNSSFTLRTNLLLSMQVAYNRSKQICSQMLTVVIWWTNYLMWIDTLDTR